MKHTEQESPTLKDDVAFWAFMVFCNIWAAAGVLSMAVLCFAYALYMRLPYFISEWKRNKDAS